MKQPPWLRAALCGLLIACGAAPAAAQTGRVALDVLGAVDAVNDSTPRRFASVWLDVFAAVRVADGLDVVVRPVVSRRNFDGVWQKQMFQLGLRYERAPADGRSIGFRLEAGQLPSPIGIAMLENRPDLNPLVSQHSAYYLPVPRIDREQIPRTFLIAGAYPLGAQATVASRTWDARVAVLDSSPVRGRPFFGVDKPPRLLNTVAGIGVTPRVGLRLGVAMARGAYVSMDEVVGATSDRDATMVQAEGEWSFRHTRIVGEWVRSALQTARADAIAAGGWVQVSQTLTPRLFVASRMDAQHFDYQRPRINDVERQTYKRFEAILGFRLTPDLTLRGGYLGRNGYVVSHWDDQAIGSIVWQRKIY